MTLAVPWYFGPPGALVQLPDPNEAPDISVARIGGVQELLGEGRVGDTTGVLSTMKVAWKQCDVGMQSLMEKYLRLPLGPYVLLNPYQENLLTPNQSTGGDYKRTADGVIVRFQGTMVVDTAQFHSDTRSFRWDPGGAFGGTNRGFYFYNSLTVIDKSWCPVNTFWNYIGSVWLRSASTVSMKAAIDWYQKDATYLSTSFGTAANVGTTWTRFVVSATAPTNAAYGILLALNNTSAQTTASVWADDARLVQDTVDDGGWLMGLGVPRLRLDSLDKTPKRGFFPLMDITANFVEL